MAQKRRFELQGLKFEIGKLSIDVSGDDGEKQIEEALADSLGHALAPVAQAMRAQLPAPSAQEVPVPAAVEEKRGSRRSRRSANGPSSAGGVALPWKPNIEKHGNPSPAWASGKKAVWLLDCYSKENGGSQGEPKGLTIPVVVATYNKHFPHAKPIKSSHVYRDLNNYAAANPPLVTVNRNEDPPVWYIAPAGARVIEDLVKSATAPLLATVA